MNNSTGGVKYRKAGVIQRLEKQLSEGTKRIRVYKDDTIRNRPLYGKKYNTIEETISLTQGDITRINKELNTLRGR